MSAGTSEAELGAREAVRAPARGWFATAWHHPRKLGLRRVLFQVHLWLGLILLLWVMVLGVSGSVLVFEEELDRWALGPVPQAGAGQAPVAASRALAAAEAGERGSRPTYLMLPSPGLPWYQVWFRTAGGEQAVVAVAPTTGQVKRPRYPGLLRAVERTHDLHVNLLAGPRGLLVNGVLSAGLLLLAVSGIALWWPGVRGWARGLRVELLRKGRRWSWRRLSLQMHHAVGFWTLLWSLAWAASSVYFAFPAVVERWIGHVSPVVAMRAPSLAVDRTAPLGRPASLDEVLQRAAEVSPGHFLSGTSLPLAPRGMYVVAVNTGKPADFSHRDFVSVSGATGAVLSVWHYGANRSAGDRLLWAAAPLHFGTTLGLGVKVVWAALGLSLPVLAGTGLLMFGSRKLRGRATRRYRVPARG